MTANPAPMQLGWGPHNIDEAIEQALGMAAAMGEIAMGLMRQRNVAQQDQKGLVVAGANAPTTPEAVNAHRARMAQEARRHGAQVQQGIEQATHTWRMFLGVLAVPTGAPKPASEAAQLADAAGTAEAGPKLKLA